MYGHIASSGIRDQAVEDAFGRPVLGVIAAARALRLLPLIQSEPTGACLLLTASTGSLNGSLGQTWYGKRVPATRN